jgi:membrane protein DedA with SNARE-associated domain
MFIALLLSTFVSEDLACVAAGLAIARGAMSLPAALLACATGIWLGDLGLWLVGRLAGAKVLAWRRVSGRLPPDVRDRFAEWFEARTGRAILGSRFVPGSRLPLYLAAGACRTSFVRFAAWTAVAVALWTPLLVLGTVAAGERLARWVAVGRAATILTGVSIVIAWHVATRLASLRHRQRAAAAIARVWRWEFWPMWLFYAPVAAWTAWLALRHRGFRTITAANPGMPDGGVLGESKFAILSRLPEEWTVPTDVLEPGPACARAARLHGMLRSRKWSFPLVLKPDVGQRGTGVRLVRTEGEAREYLSRLADRVLVQPYHAGPYEAGVFYYRRPGEARGRILAITDKHFPFVLGDGRSTLEDLVWAHPRCRMQARTFLARLGERRATIPTDGERIVLAIAGNHAQGTLFTDGREMITPALEARVDAIARQFDGFFIGRFDVRYADREAFMAGRDLAIVELNGATAECTNIYDPDRSLLAAYRTLFLQWRLVFEIGAANRRAGRAVSSTERLVQLLREHLRTDTPFAVSD